MGINKKRLYIFIIALFGCLFIVAGSLLLRGDRQTAYAASAPSVSRYTLPAEIENIFTDYTCTELSDKNITLEDIEGLEARYTDEASQKYLQRAEQIVRGGVKYSGLSEFTDSNGKIVQAGDLSANCSRLNLRYDASDLILTGIYGLTGQEIRVFVEAESNYLPQLVITQNHGFWNGGYRQNITLNKGMNVFTYSDFVSGSTHINQNEVKGGAIYLSNPYTHEQQGDVGVYIEGCGYYPVFKKGDDDGAFLGMLKEYEANRKKSPARLLDMAELITDHTIITTTSSSLYDAYITQNAISPALNLELWGDFMTELLEFNGIATSPQSRNDNWAEANDYINVNFRYMSVQPDSGAYTTSYHIGYYYEHAWFANFYANIDSQWIYNIAHEIGHQIDTRRRAIDETTNNMTATYAYVVLLRRQALPKWQPFERGFNALSSDNSLGTDAFKDGHILYPQDDIRDRNYMIWWYLESVFPNFWADLNNMFRADPANGLTANEKMVYYSSLVTGVDLSEYYERWGFFKESQYNKFNRNSTSDTFKKLMQSDKIKGTYSHFWLADSAEFDYIRSNTGVAEQEKEYASAPFVTSVERTAEGRKIVLSNTPCASHLGYEIYVTTDGGSYKIAGFTYTNTFSDKHDYGGATPVYKAIAVNRYFKTTGFGNAMSEGQTTTPLYACRVGETGFATLEEAMYAVTKVEEYKGKTIYLLADCHIDKYEFFPEVKIAVAEEVDNDITITGGSEYLFKSNYHFSMKGRENARIIIEGGSLNRAHGAFMLGSGNDLFEYVTFQNCKTTDRGGAIYQIFGSVTLNNCKFINCSSANDNCALYFQDPSGAKSLKIYNCEFENDNTDIYFGKNDFNLIFDGSVPEVTLGFPQTEESVSVLCENFEVSEGDLARIGFADPQYFATVKDGGIKISARNFRLTFDDNGTLYHTTLRSASFVFGSEDLEGFDDKKYIANYRDKSTGTDYKRGDKLTVGGDMTFDITVEDKFALNLEYMQGTSTEYFAEGEGVYLPLFDSGGNKIYRWIAPGSCYYAGGVYKEAQSQTLKADYLDYFRVEFWVNGVLLEYNYQRYGGQITTPDCGEPDFKGWLADGGMIAENATYTVEKDIKFTAAAGDYAIYDLNGATIQISDSGFTYTGEPHTPRVKVFIDNEELSPGLYAVEYGDNINAGAATITVKPHAQNVTGQKSITFTIARAQMPDVGSATIYAEQGGTLSDIVLPENFEWVDGSLRITAHKITAWARYVGDDKQNYETTEILFEIIVENIPEPAPSTPPEDPGQDPDAPENDRGDGTESGADNDNSDKTMIWVAVVVPVVSAAGAAAVFLIVRHRRRKR